MKKSWLYILLVVSMSDYASFNQMFKLPALVYHFIEHHELDNRVGIIDYLSMHYWGEDLNDNDQDKDMQLPFKKMETHTALQLAVPAGKTTIETQQIFSNRTSVRIIEDNHLSNPALGSLFRPPRA